LTSPTSTPPAICSCRALTSSRNRVTARPQALGARQATSRRSRRPRRPLRGRRTCAHVERLLA
jgi:hypothetical protein